MDLTFKVSGDFNFGKRSVLKENIDNNFKSQFRQIGEKKIMSVFMFVSYAILAIKRTKTKQQSLESLEL